MAGENDKSAGSTLVDKLYHGTLLRNVHSIRTKGLLPQKGLWTAGFHLDAVELVYAADEDHKGSFLVAIAGQMTKSGLVEWSDKYQFGDFKNDLIQHGAVVVVVARATFRRYPDHFQSGHPSGTEPGNWYSQEFVPSKDIEGILTGQEMLDWLKPSEADFRYRFSDILASGTRKEVC
jgi:hypothetical protein